MNDDIFQGLGVEIRLFEEDDFLKVRETLTRIGISSPKEKRLYQSCHILHKRGRYAIFHFKELFSLDGKPTNFSDDDMGRRNTITALLEDWGLLEVVDKDKLEEGPKTAISQIKIISYREKPEWELITKYSIGNSAA